MSLRAVSAAVAPGLENNVAQRASRLDLMTEEAVALGQELVMTYADPSASGTQAGGESMARARMRGRSLRRGGVSRVVV